MYQVLSVALKRPVNLENSAVAIWLEKLSFHTNLKEGNVKESSKYHRIAVISHSSKVMLKILQVRLQQYVNGELPDVQAVFRKCSSVQFSHVRLFVTPWIAMHQASLSITKSRRSLRLTSIESVMSSSHLILCCPLSSCCQHPLDNRKSKRIPEKHLFLLHWLH